tara:strand:+ start:1911 stop:3167 length:1257 start_codon:yes stop_codon:yes gene_type:complete
MNLDKSNLYIKFFLFSSLIFFILNDPFVFNNYYLFDFKIRAFSSLFVILATSLIIFEISQSRKNIIFNKKNYVILILIFSFFLIETLINKNFFLKENLKFLFLYSYILSTIIIIKFYRYKNPQIILNSVIYFSQTLAILAIIGWFFVNFIFLETDFLQFKKLFFATYRDYEFTIFGGYIDKNFAGITLYRTCSFFKEPIYAAIFFFINLSISYKYGKNIYSSLIFLIAGISTLSYTFVILLILFTILQIITKFKNILKKYLPLILLILSIFLYSGIKIFENDIYKIIKYSSYKDRYDRNISFTIRFIKSDIVDMFLKTKQNEMDLGEVNYFIEKNVNFLPSVERIVPPDSTFFAIIDNKGLLFLIFFIFFLLHANSIFIYFMVIFFVGLVINISTLPIYLFQYCLYGILKRKFTDEKI